MRNRRNGKLPPLVASDEEVLSIIQKQVKQRRDSIDEFEKAKREDLVARERAEDECSSRTSRSRPPRGDRSGRGKVIAETGASGPRDIGKVMPVLTKQFAGRADGRIINEIVRRLLGS